jgi:tRNA pseudouridine55 synthase
VAIASCSSCAASKRNASIATPDGGDLVGILNIDKPGGWTSHDVVARVRRLAGQKRVGHAGTLDPMASGVLPVLLGRATRLADFIQLGRKTYAATIRLGASMDTDDAEGTLMLERPVPPLTDELLEDTLAAFRGDILQTPPRYSALKVAGRRAYAVARAGGEVELAPRPVTIDDLRLVAWSASELKIEVTCSKGTYIRSLARDVGIALGTLGHMRALVRTRVGSFALDEAVGLEALERVGVATSLLPASRALPEAPTYAASADETLKLVNGQAIAVEGLRAEDVWGLRAEGVWVYDPQGRLVCLASADGSLLRPRLAL